MCCKHNRLPTQKLVLISKAGFTGNAAAKARSLGVECHNLASAEKVDWTKYVDRLSSIFLAAIDATMAVVPYSPTYTSEDPFKGTSMNTRFLDAQGEFRATADEIAHAVLANGSIFAATVAKMNVANGGGWEITIPLQSGVRMRLPNGDEHAVHELKVVLLAHPLIVRFVMERASFRDAQIAYGSSSNDKGEFLVTIVETEGSTVNAQLRIRRPWGEVQTYSLAGKTEDTWGVASDDAMKALVGGLTRRRE